MQALPSPSLLNGSQDQQTVQSQDRNDLMDRSMALSLANIRGSLIRQEDTIIFSLIERSQFSLNAPVYNEGDLSVQALLVDNCQCSLPRVRPYNKYGAVHTMLKPIKTPILVNMLLRCLYLSGQFESHVKIAHCPM